MRSLHAALFLAAVAMTAPALHADDTAPQSVTVSFGAGLNTAFPGFSPNHHILPKVITVRTNGVVNFVVAGLHWPRVYKPGTKPSDIDLNSPTGTAFLINDDRNLLYDGLNPGGNAGGAPSFYPRANAGNRVESVSFPAAGNYLVICNVRPHFLDGMWAFVHVVDVNDDQDAAAALALASGATEMHQHNH